jgi:hypothetical protein
MTILVTYKILSNYAENKHKNYESPQLALV